MSDNFNTFICANCNAQFSRKDNLKRHLSTRCYGLNLTKLKSREPVKFFCAHCDRVFKQNRNLKTHLLSKRCPRLKNVQLEIQIPVSDNVCINCKATFTRKSSLKVHFSSRCPKRSNVFKPKEKGVVVLNFNSDEEFLLWKDEEEQRTLSKFSQSKGSWKTKRGEKTKYVCHRAGYVRIKDPSNRKRSLKRKGSCKINNHCTAFILIEKHSDGSVSAQYSRKHINHFIEIKHLPLSVHDKTEFASKLEEGVPFDRILDVRDSLSDSRKLTRKHLVSKHDLHNIKNEFKISFKEWLSSNDIVSVDLLINQFKKTYGTETSFLYYKQQGVEDEVFEKDDILLVIMNPTQKTFLQKYGPDKICINSTHCTTSYDYLLNTILVVDDLNLGIPVAHIISNKENTWFLKTFFEVIKTSCGVIKTNTFMSDDFLAYYNAWEQVMGSAENRSLCTWHIDRNWRKNLTLIKDNKESVLAQKCGEESISVTVCICWNT